MVSLAVVYNAMVIPLRASFGDDVEGSNVLYMWLVFDYLFDLVYWLDLLAIQPFLCMAASESSKVREREREREREESLVYVYV